VAEDHDMAIEESKMLICQYLAQQPHIVRESNVPQDTIAEIKSILG
jgi:hypothetical protein